MSSPGLIDVREVGKTYRGGVRALDGVTLSVAAGEVYGLVGPNGAGKTTLLRMMTGLVATTSGRVRVGDGRVDAGVGSLIESPAFYPSMSGRQNLTLLCTYWSLPARAAERALGQVGLSVRDGRRPYRQYSLGMKQRLGIAAALLGEPRIVVLDEPTNGLDPESIASVRDTVRGLRDRGCAVVLSSHLLGEVEQVADRVGILVSGHLIAEGTVDELGRRVRAHRGVDVEVDDADAALTAGRQHGLAATALAGGRVRFDLDDATQPWEVNAMLVAAGVHVNALAEVGDSLEETFFGLISESTPLERSRS
ncbi:ABC transporter ATP-binding protein [Microbacterium invictum]|uniref:ABC-2 type transport system ATP-binding protein n=1 Tax=Microbacterium invictum TaxID=515415 RepID=A0AA40SS12_9MICO|nr:MULTISPECIES: ABC transporter ATP-binding protein [Microbacterium]MBB4141338.1 ABC-2 type transport system ATP-binding protein [Microbacterium invictum]